MRIDVDPALAAHAAVAIKARIRQLERDGFAVPAGLAILADQLMAPEGDAVTRARTLAKLRKRRQRIRQRAARARAGCHLAEVG